MYNLGIATIKLVSTNVNSVNLIANQIKDVAKAINVTCKGPIPFPTKRMTHTTRKTPCGRGSHTFEKWEMRFHKRIIQIEGSEQVLRQVMRIQVPDDIQIEISLS